MATDLLTPGAWRFAGDPFRRFDEYYGPGGRLDNYRPGDLVYSLGGDSPSLMTPERRDAWMASDELLASDPELFGNATNLKVVSQDENGYTVMRKTGDKEGTLIRIERDPATGEFVSKGAVGTEAWDTNAAQRFQNMGFGSVIAAALGAAAAQGSGLVGQGVSGFSGPNAFLGAGEIASFGAGGAGGGLLGSAAAGLSQAELAALIESGTQGAAGLGLEAAGINGAGLTAAQYAALQGGGSLVANAGIDGVVNAALTGTQTPVGIDPTGSNVLRYPETPPAPPNSGPPAPPGTPPTQPGPTTPPPTTPNPGGIVKVLTDAGLPAWLANAIVGLGPAAAALLSDHDPQSTTSQTTVSPQQQAARDAISTAVTNRLPEGMARDRQRADQQMAWANLAAGVPGQYTMPPPVIGQGMTAPQPIFGRQGMMGGFVPPNSMIRRA
jgi:hypothetical protein